MNSRLRRDGLKKGKGEVLLAVVELELFLYLMGIFLIFFEGLVVVDALTLLGFFFFWFWFWFYRERIEILMNDKEMGDWRERKS